LESIAAEEIERELGGEIKRTAPGMVVFRPAQVDKSILQLRTVEDVFLFAWGTDRLTRRASKDLDAITRWTAREPDWEKLLRLHHAVHPKPKGKPTYHLVTQMRGEHVYRRVDALKSLARGLDGKFPTSWKPAEENAAVEVWLTIHDSTAICGLRLSDKNMRHRTYKEEHLPASLRPVVAAAMVRLAKARTSQLMLDPMCGAGTILAEQMIANPQVLALGGDLETAAVHSAINNLRHLGSPWLARWDARRLPFPGQSIACLVCNPPFGRQLGEPEDIAPLYARLLSEFNRVMEPGGRAVLLVSDLPALSAAAEAVSWRQKQRVPVRILGHKAVITVWNKP
jgi:23S rRNA G2445 N2-methylase RlmL